MIFIKSAKPGAKPNLCFLLNKNSTRIGAVSSGGTHKGKKMPRGKCTIMVGNEVAKYAILVSLVLRGILQLGKLLMCT